MPRGNRRGPDGMGPATGRGMGYCSGYDAPGYMNQGFGFRQGAGRGFNRRHAGYGFRSGNGMNGYGAGFYPAAPVPGYSREAEKEYIEAEMTYLKDHMKTLENRLSELADGE